MNPQNKPAQLSQVTKQLYEIGKLPPQAVEMEEAVLGALMLERDALAAVVDLLYPRAFYKEAHSRIFEAIQNLSRRNEPVDILTVTNELKRTGELEVVGGAYYISQLTGRVASAANVEFHARIIVQKAVQRDLITASSTIITDAYEDTTDIFDLLDRSERALFSITQRINRGAAVRHVKELTKEVKDDYMSREENRTEGGVSGVPSGFRDLDRMTTGWKDSDLVIVAARPAMGKTAFVLSLARNAAVDFKRPVVVFSLEMANFQLVQRLIVAEAEVDSHKFKTADLGNGEINEMWRIIPRLDAAPMFLDDTAALSIFEMRAKCRRLKSQHDIQLVIVDYLQLMTTGNEGNKYRGNREQEISEISRNLKAIAKELGVPVIALSQLSRQVESRGGDKRPHLSDLRESGAIEQDADMVIFIHRPEYYGFTQDAEGNNTAGQAEIIIAKHRNGAVGTVNLRFIDRLAKFTNPENSMPDLPPQSSLAPNTDFTHTPKKEDDPF